MSNPSNLINADGTPRIQLLASLTKGEFLLLRSGGGDLEALKKARTTFRRINAKVKHDPTYDSVTEVRKYRDGVED